MAFVAAQAPRAGVAAAEVQCRDSIGHRCGRECPVPILDTSPAKLVHPAWAPATALTLERQQLHGLVLGAQADGGVAASMRASPAVPLQPRTHSHKSGQTVHADVSQC